MNINRIAQFKAGAAPLVLGLALIAAPAAAQTTSPDTPETRSETDSPAVDTQASDIVVTGSRIQNPNLISASPVTVVSAAEVKFQGTARTEDLINNLPQVFASQGSTDANGATGIATVNLRGLGDSRTLVLVNGRRLGPGDPTSPVPDLNFIPAALIQRVDVLTGGASSAYGSDAVAGVVNFIMNREFTGVQLDAQYGIYTHNNNADQNIRDALNARRYGYPTGLSADGGITNIALTVGAKTEDGRGHVTAYATYLNAQEITSGDRDFSVCALQEGPANAFSCGGSSTAGPGRFLQTSLVGFAAGQPVYAPSGPSFTVSGNQFIPYVGARDAFNYNPYNYFQRPNTRYSFGAFAHYEINEHFDPYLEVMFMDDRTVAQIAPSGAFFGTDFFVNCNNPLLSAQQATALCGANAGTGTLQSVYIGRRNVEGGGRQDDLRHTAYRVVLGTRGKIAEGVTYDVFGLMNRALLAERYGNDFSRTRLNRALNVVRDPATGAAVCASARPDANGVVLDPNCVPYNIFQTGGVTQAALDYLQTPGFKSGETTTWIASATFNVDFGETTRVPWANNSPALAFGAEYHEESLSLRNDIQFLTGDLAGQGTPFGVPDASGRVRVKEAFAEINVPLIDERPFFYSLGLEAGYRISDYSTSGQVDSYKLGLQWAPVRDIRFRASYSRSVRAPNVLNLFSPPTVQLFNSVIDPCAGPVVNGTVNGNTFAQCARSGVTAAQFGNIDESPAGQYNQRTAGNANLVPETGDSWTVGVLLQPQFLPRFVLSVDAFDIRVNNVIGTFGADFTLQQCVATGNPLFCNRVQRSAGSGSLFVGNGFVDNPTSNLGKLRERGIDINASYRTTRSDSLGSFGFNFVGTYIDKFETQPLPTAIDPRSYDCVGLFGITCGSPNPRWRHAFRVTWTMPSGIELSGAWRYFAPVTNESNSSNALLGAPGSVTGLDARLPAVNFFDLAMRARINDNFTFRLGAQNLLDQTPPVRSSTYSNNATNTYAQVYDSRGRYLYAGVTLEF